MMYALYNNNRIKAHPLEEGKAICPLCKKEVIKKCGDINIWHWSHTIDEGCAGGEPETKWHIDWKEKFNENFREIIIKNNNKYHIADIYNGVDIIEFQHSPIDINMITIREHFYNNMCWVFDAENIYKNFHFNFKTNKYGKKFVGFRWKWGRQSIILGCKKPIFLDFGNGNLLFIGKVTHLDNGKSIGWGNIIHKEKFITFFKEKRRGDSWQKLRNY